MAKIGELRDLTLQELREREQQLMEEQYNLRFQAAAGQLENPGRIKEARRTMARVKTLIRARQLAGEE